jgi:hypothetical protein
MVSPRFSHKTPLCFVLLCVGMSACGTTEKRADFPVIWEDDNAETHHDISHQDLLPSLAGPVVEESLHDLHAEGSYGIGVMFAPHASSDFDLTGSAELSESSHSMEAVGLNLSYFTGDDFELRLGYEETSFRNHGTSYNGVLIGPDATDNPTEHIGGTELSFGFRHYLPTYRLRPYLGADVVLRDWNQILGETDSDEEASINLDGQTLLALEVGVRYLWNEVSAVQLGFRFLNPLDVSEGTADHTDGAVPPTLTSDDDLEADQSGWRIVLGVNWVF